MEEAVHLDTKNEHPYLHITTCFIILDNIFLLEDEDSDLWRSLDSHYTETLKLIVEFFKRIVGLNTRWPTKPDFWKDLKIYTDMDRLDAFTLLDLCKRIRPDDPDVWLMTAEINYDKYSYEHKGQQNAKRYLELAEECLTKTIELDPKKHHAWDLLAEVYFEKKEYDKAIECYMKRLELDEYKIPSIGKKLGSKRGR